MVMAANFVLLNSVDFDHNTVSNLYLCKVSFISLSFAFVSILLQFFLLPRFTWYYGTSLECSEWGHNKKDLLFSRDTQFLGIFTMAGYLIFINEHICLISLSQINSFFWELFWWEGAVEERASVLKPVKVRLVVGLWWWEDVNE